MNNKVCIIVPVYKEKLNFHEYNSLIQLQSILSPEKYDIHFICPEYLNFSYYEEHFKYKYIFRFWDSYFIDNSTYSKLMLNENFYKYFQEYEYMLIYQTDGWVFKDDLIDWCEKGYEYIGAPFMFRYPSSKSAAVQHKLYNGNGGVSLRKISWIIENIEKYKTTLPIDGIYEDITISQYFDIINKPSFIECSKFSWDTYPDVLWQVNQFEIPSFCHNYIKNGYDFYKNFDLITYYKFEDDLCK